MPLKVIIAFEESEGFGPQINEVIRAVEANLAVTAEIVYQDAKKTLAFKDKTGNLRKSIRLKKSKFKDGGFIVEARGKNKDKGYHAWLVEYGHLEYAFSYATGRRVPPHPYMRPASEKGVTHAMTLHRKVKIT